MFIRCFSGKREAALRVICKFSWCKCSAISSYHCGVTELMSLSVAAGKRSRISSGELVRDDCSTPLTATPFPILPPLLDPSSCAPFFPEHGSPSHITCYLLLRLLFIIDLGLPYPPGILVCLVLMSWKNNA